MSFSVLKTVAATAALTLSAGAASAAPIYADTVIDFQGDCATGGCAAYRSDPTKALGAADGEFVSLGLGGSITLGFSGVPNLAGDATVYEVTWGNRANHPEAAQVYSVLGGDETLLGTITNANGANSVSLSGPFDSIKIVDYTVSYFNGNTSSFDGFDVDSVSISAVPLPATGLMLLAGLGGFAAMRRKKS